MIREHRQKAAVLCLMFAPAICAADEMTPSGKYFRIICHFDNEQVAKEALETAEMVWPVAAKLYAVTDRAPDRLRDVHLYRTADDYMDAEFKLTGGKFKNNLAFSHWDSQTAHIAIQPECSDDTLKQTGLPTMTRRLIAHEAAHLARYAIMPNFESHPNWFADGTGEWIEDKVIADGGWSQGFESEPATSTMIMEAQGLLKDHSLPSVDEIFNDDIDNVFWRKRYALRGLLFRMLVDSTDRETLESIMKQARQQGGGRKYPKILKGIVADALGSEKMSALNAKYKEYIAGMKPKWEEFYGSLETAGDEWTQIAFPKKNAIAWNTAPNNKDTYAITGEFKILPGWKQQLNLLLGRQSDGFFSIAIVAGGGLTAFEYKSADNNWNRLGYAPVDTLKLDRWVRFRVEVTKDKMQVVMDEKPALSCPLGSRPARGPWGLGAQAGSAGMWRNIKFE